MILIRLFSCKLALFKLLFWASSATFSSFSKDSSNIFRQRLFTLCILWHFHCTCVHKESQNNTIYFCYLNQCVIRLIGVVLHIRSLGLVSARNCNFWLPVRHKVERPYTSIITKISSRSKEDHKYIFVSFIQRELFNL